MDNPHDPQTEVRVPKRPHRHYSEADKARGLTALASAGPIKAERITGIPNATIRDWANTEQGRRTVEEAKHAFNQFAAVEQQDIFRTVIGLLKDRLVQGDERLTKDGTIVNVAVQARDLAVIGGIAFDKVGLAFDGLLSDSGANQVTPEQKAALDTLEARLLQELVKRKLKASTVEVDGQTVGDAEHQMSHRPLDPGNIPTQTPGETKEPLSAPVKVQRQGRKVRKDAGTRKVRMKVEDDPEK